VPILQSPFGQLTSTKILRVAARTRGGEEDADPEGAETQLPETENLITLEWDGGRYSLELLAMRNGRRGYVCLARDGIDGSWPWLGLGAVEPAGSREAIAAFVTDFFRSHGADFGIADPRMFPAAYIEEAAVEVVGGVRQLSPGRLRIETGRLLEASLARRLVDEIAKVGRRVME
jgi:hypothetical protein